MTPAEIQALRDLAAMMEQLQPKESRPMQNAQSRMDKGAEHLMRLIKAAEAGAVEACAAGDSTAAATLHRMAAYMRLAYAEGRTLNIGGIAPAFGGKD